MPTRRCIFCGGKAGNREHIFPDWLSERFGQVDARVVFEKEGSRKTSFNSKIFQHVVKSVCHDCNHGWMSSIEQKVAPYLGDMARGENLPTELNPQRQHDLAVWAQKTLLVIQSIYPSAERNMSPLMYSEFYSRKDVLLASATFIGFNEQKPRSGGHAAGAHMYTITNARVRKQDVAYFDRAGLKNSRFIAASLKIGHVNFHCIATDMQNITFGIEFPYGGYIQMISPTPQHDNINWPTTFRTELIGGWEVAHSALATNFFVERLPQFGGY